MSHHALFKPFVHACCAAHVEFRELDRAGALLLTHGSLGQNSGHQTWGQVSSPTDPPCQLSHTTDSLHRMGWRCRKQHSPDLDFVKDGTRTTQVRCKLCLWTTTTSTLSQASPEQRKLFCYDKHLSGLVGGNHTEKTLD